MEDNPFRYFTAIFALEEQLKPLAGIEKIFSGFAAGIRELAAACASLRDALAGFLDGDLPENLKILEKTEKTLAPPTNPAYCPFAPDIAMAKAPEPLLRAGALEPQTQAMPPEPLSRASAALPNLPRLASANPQKQQTPKTGKEPLPVVSLLEPLRQIVPQALGIFPGLGEAPKISGQILDVAIKAAKLPEIFGKKPDVAPQTAKLPQVAQSTPQTGPLKQQTPKTGKEPLPVVSLLEPLRQIVPQALGIFPGLGEAPKISGQILDVAIKAAKLSEIFGKKPDVAPQTAKLPQVAQSTPQTGPLKQQTPETGKKKSPVVSLLEPLRQIVPQALGIFPDLGEAPKISGQILDVAIKAAKFPEIFGKKLDVAPQTAKLPQVAPPTQQTGPRKQQTPETGKEKSPVVSLLEPLRQIVPQALGIFPGIGDAPKISGQILDVAIKAAKLPEIFGKKHDAAPLATGNASVAELPRTPPFAAPSNTLKGPAKDIGDIIKVFVGRGAGRENFLQKVPLPAMPSMPLAPEIPEISVPEPVLPDPPEAPEHIARIAEEARARGESPQQSASKVFNISSATFILNDVKNPQDLLSQIESSLSEYGESLS